MIRRRRVLISPNAASDLDAIHDAIERKTSNAVARRFIDRIEAFCVRLDIASERGALRDDLLPGLRTVGFERRLTITFIVEGDAVRILRIFRAGQDWEAAFEEPTD